MLIAFNPECFKYLASFLFLLFTVNAVAASRVQCGAMKSKYVPGHIGYCAMLPPSYDASPGKRFPVLYFLHGLGGDQSFLASSGASSAIEEAWEEKRLGQFVIITPQGENSFYINSRDGHILYEDFFVREFVPQMERRFRLLARPRGTGDRRRFHGRLWRVAVCLQVSADVCFRERAHAGAAGRASARIVGGGPGALFWETRLARR